jgi:PilZ domain
MGAGQREAIGMPPAGTRLTLATLVGAAEARVVQSIEDEVVVLSDGCGLHEGANASTRIYDGERVWHLTFRVRERHELAPQHAQIGLTLNERKLLGEERSLPRVACRLAATARPAGDAGVSAWASVVDVSQGGLALRSATTYGAGDLIDIDLDDGTGAVISARVEIVDQTDGLARGRIVAVADDGAHRLGALVDRLRNSPSDGEPEPEPLPALREALAAARRLQA